MLKKYTAILAIAVLFVSCTDEDSGTVPVPDYGLYMVNSDAETISVIDLETVVLFPDIFKTDLIPAEMKYYEGCIYVVNSTSNTLQRFPLVGGWEESIELGDNRNPVFMEIVGEDSMAIVNFISGTVSLVDLNAGAVLKEISVGLGLWGMTYHQGKIYVGISNLDMVTFSYGQGRVAKIDAATMTLEDSVDVGVNPGVLFVDIQGELNVVCIGDYWSVFGEVWRVDLESFQSIDHFSIGGTPGYEAVDQWGNVYLGAGGWNDDDPEAYILQYNSITEEIIHDQSNPIVITGELGASGLAVDDAGDIYVCCFGWEQISNKIVKINPQGEVLETFEVESGWGPQYLILLDSRPRVLAGK